MNNYILNPCKKNRLLNIVGSFVFSRATPRNPRLEMDESPSAQKSIMEAWERGIGVKDKDFPLKVTLIFDGYFTGTPVNPHL